MKDIIVSIIVPVYNVERYIERCLSSIANQTVRAGIECIIIDDCGNDESFSIAELFVESHKDSEIKWRLLRNKHNLGLSGTRNYGIKVAQGDYFYLLDSDDELKPDCIEGFLHIINKHHGVDLIQGLFDQDSPYMNQFWDKPIPLYSDDTAVVKRLLLDCDAIPITAANRMYRTEMFRSNNLYFKEGIIHEDNYLAFFLAKCVRSFALYRNKCYVYNITPNSITRAVNICNEQKAFTIMINDFCDNIDPCLHGAQKMAIFRTMLQAIDSQLYESNDVKKGWINRLKKENSLIGKSLIHMCFAKSEGYFRRKLVNLTIRLYRLNLL